MHCFPAQEYGVWAACGLSAFDAFFSRSTAEISTRALNLVPGFALSSPSIRHFLLR
jgi:hypothetical protein